MKDWFMHAEADQSEYFLSLEMAMRKEQLLIDEFYQGRYRPPSILLDDRLANEENQ